MSQSQQRPLTKHHRMKWRRANLLRRTRRRDRRGVLLMVVLSMLALFLLLGTAFLVSSQFYWTSAKESAKENRTENNPYDLMERAMLQVLRDTNNPSSSIRYHSLLRDMYGADGFVARVYPDATTYFCEYSGNNQFGSPAGNGLGPTNGQFIDLYVGDFPLPNPNALALPEHVIKLDRNPDGRPVDLTLSAATGYYNGCLLTMLEGPAANQTTRILDYRLVGFDGNNVPVYRLRLMSFGRADGGLLSQADLAGMAGAAFMVNGRPHNGTGAGYNRLATGGKPRLSAVEMLVDTANNPIDFHEIALTPNYRYFPSGLSQFDQSSGVSLLGSTANGGGFVPFGNATTGQLLYMSPDGPGGSDESYDAVDYQNMALAHLPLSPRAMASAIDDTGATSELTTDLIGGIFSGQTTNARFDHENTIIPSFHRPALFNYWYHRLMGSSWVNDSGSISAQDLTVALAYPYGEDYQRDNGDETQLASPAVHDLLVSIKRKLSLRPIPEDHPNFDGTNPVSRTVPFWEFVGPWDVDNDNDGIADSVWVDLGDAVQEREDGTLYKAMYAFLIIDLDNRLNVNAHGSPDHFANTNFDPLIATTGTVGNLAGTASSNLLPVGMGWGPADASLRPIFSPLTQPYHANYLSSFNPYNGLPEADDYARLLYGRLPADPNSDAIWGRLGNTVTSGSVLAPGMTFNPTDLATIAATREPLLPFEFVGYPVGDRLRAERLYLNTNDARLLPYMQPSSFGTSPDLRGRYTVGIDYTGQPVHESTYDQTDPTSLHGLTLAKLVDDSPYETDLTSQSRRGLPRAITPQDDAPFAIGELERILRAYDPETGTAPSRLWDLVDSFDPNKYALTIASDAANITPEEMAFSQGETAANRMQVTTDSVEVPVPADVVPSYITELGPDGAPGNGPNNLMGENPDDDGNGVADEPVPFNIQQGQGEIGWYAVQDRANPATGLYLVGWSDDFASLTGKSVAEARLVDVVWYRIQRERMKKFLIDGETRPYNWNNPQAVAILSNISNQLLPPEVLAGYKMDINRPFGDGVDNNGNGVVDEPMEAGEPYDPATGKFIDLNGNGVYDQPTDRLWAAQLGGAGVGVDAVMGQDVAQTPFTDANGNGIFDPGEELVPETVRNDAHLARQLYARHLYMLMLVLMDEDYVMPYDPSDPSIRGYLRIKALQLSSSGMPAAEAKLEAQRRYTCRQIAQWAANCVDFRDADATNTAFEYDENPWDGWGTINDNGTPIDLTDDIHYPLDGDATTDENYGQVIDWGSMDATGAKVITNAIAKWGNGGNQLKDTLATRGLVWGAERPELLISETAAIHDMRLEDLTSEASGTAQGDHYFNQPKQGDPINYPADDDLDQRLSPRGSLFVEIYNPWSDDAPKPVELYRHGIVRHPQETDDEFENAFDQDGNGSVDPNETYHLADVDGNIVPIEGVLLNRLSDVGALDPRTGKVKRSPVWRLIVVEEHPGYHKQTGQDSYSVQRNGGTVPTARDDSKSHAGNLSVRNVSQGSQFSYGPMADYERSLIAAYSAAVASPDYGVPYLAPMNMDWDSMYFLPPYVQRQPTMTSWPMSSWQQRFTGFQQGEQANTPDNQQGQFDRHMFAKPYPYIEREFYFTSNNSKMFRAQDVEIDNTYAMDGSECRAYTGIAKLRDYYAGLNVRIPFNYIPLTGGNNRFSVPFRFVAPDINNQDGPSPSDVKIAPVLPGRYAVIGAAGTHYKDNRYRNTDDNHPERPRFITTLGRNKAQGNGMDKETADDTHLGNVPGTRRFEIQPSTNPYLQQWMVGSNGASFFPGADTERHGELIYLDSKGQTVNMTTGSVNAARQHTGSEVVAPVVAVPVDDMNVSEPAYGYGPRWRELAQLENGKGFTGQDWSANAVGGEGAFTNGGGGFGAANADPAHFDTPFDPPEYREAYEAQQPMKRFRVVHLQRLADPTMPWNPPPIYNQADAQKAVDRYDTHDPALPVNPYLTVDSATVDLSIINGTSSTNAPAASPNRLYKSRERMSESQVIPPNSEVAAANALALPDRVNWNEDYFIASHILQDEVRRVPKEGDLRRLRPDTRRSSIRQDIQDDHFVSQNHHDFYFNHSLGIPNEAMGDFYARPETGLSGTMPEAVDPTDLVGDDSAAEPEVQQRTMGSALGAPRPDPSTNTISTYPWLNWTNRPFVSESELLQVPAWSSMELLRKFSVMNTMNDPSVVPQADPYDGTKTVQNGGDYDLEKTNAVRYRSMVAGFGHLLNMMQSGRDPATIQQDSSGNPVPIGAPNFHRILDYVHTPSRFVATDTMLNPTTFNPLGSDGVVSADDVTSPLDPRYNYLAPFNRVPDYREPGKVNLNTVVSQRDLGSGSGVWSDVFDGLMHRVRDNDPAQHTAGLPFGHFGPAWRDVALSRRGYEDPLFSTGSTPTSVDRVDLVMNNGSPTFFGNPFRSGEAGDLVPLSAMVQHGSEASMLRSHPFQPGAGLAWGAVNTDNNSNNLLGDAREAGIGDGNPFNKQSNQASVPLFSELCSTPAIDATRNSAMHYMPLTRLDNMTTTRSGVFAIWVTVGYFEVTAAQDWNTNEGGVATKFTNQAGGDADRGRALYNKVYPQGYQLGKELGSETGNVERHRAFYIIDRTRPVAFKPGEDVNVEDAILLRRRIE